MMKLKGNALFAAVVTVTSLGFFQIGFDNGALGSLITTTAFNNTFDSPGPTIVGLMVSILEVGAFFGSIATSFIGEKLGRRKSIAIGVVIMMLGSLLSATAFTRAHLLVARVVAGFGLGVVNSTAPVLLAEFAPKATRGLFVCMQLSTLNFATAFVYWMGYAFSFHDGSFAWRVPLILQYIFLTPMLVILLFIPETPRWLASHGRPDEALAVLQRLHHTGKVSEEEVLQIHADILRTVAVEEAMDAGTWKDILKSDAIHSRRRLLIACSIQIFQQLGGINAIIYYSSTLFQKSIGFDQHFSSLMAGFLQTWFFVASFIPWLLIDRVGRRILLLSMISLMAAVLATQAALIYQVQNKTSVAHSAGIAAAVMLFIFEGAFTTGFQATVWVYPSEILPLRLRQRGSAISTSANWICNFAIVQFTPPAIQNIGYKTYIIFEILNATWLPVSYIFYPETKGLALEDVDRLFAGEHHSQTEELFADRTSVKDATQGEKEV